MVRFLVASWINAVLHDSVKAWSTVLTGASPSALWNTSPSTVAVTGQLAADCGVSPWVISAVEVMTLNVEPGGKPPSRAWSKPPGLTETAARMSPVEAFTATSAALLLLPGQGGLGRLLHRRVDRGGDRGARVSRQRGHGRDVRAALG